MYISVHEIFSGGEESSKEKLSASSEWQQKNHAKYVQEYTVPWDLN